MTARLERAPPSSRRNFIFAGLLGAAGLTASLGKIGISEVPANSPRLASLIPMRIASWNAVSADGLVLPTEAWETDIHDQELHRVYVARDRVPIMAVVAYCGRPQQGLLQIHDPQICYPGAGFKIDQRRDLELSLGSAAVQARSFKAVRGPRVEQVVYWTRIGDRITAPDDDQHVAIVRTMLAGRVPDGLLVRLSAIGSGPAPMREIRSFAALLMQTMSQSGRELLLGRSLAASWRERA